VKPSFNFKYIPPNPMGCVRDVETDLLSLLNCQTDDVHRFITARAALKCLVLGLRDQRSSNELVVAVPNYICPEVRRALNQPGIHLVSYGNNAKGFSVSSDDVRSLLDLDCEIDVVLAACLYGESIDSKEISQLLHNRGIYFINDCAQIPFLSGEKPLPEFYGDFLLFSFAPGKPLGGITGGYLWCRSKVILKRKLKSTPVMWRICFFSSFLQRLYPRYQILNLINQLIMKYTHIDRYDSDLTVPKFIENLNIRSSKVSQKRAILFFKKYYHGNARFPCGIEVLGFQPDRLVIRLNSIEERNAMAKRLSDLGVYLGKFYSTERGSSNLSALIDTSIVIPTPQSDGEWELLQIYCGD